MQLVTQKDWNRWKPKVGCLTDGSFYTNAMLAMLASRWEIWQFNISFVCKSSMHFCSSNRAVCSKFCLNSNGTRWKQLTDSGCLPAIIICMQQHTQKWGRTFNQAQGIQDRRMLCKNRTNAERETKTVNMSPAPRNSRSHLQLNRTHGWW